jgi:protein gp37
MGKTTIAWTDITWNTLIGCSPSGPECDNCYARIAANSARLQQFPQYKGIENWDGTINYAKSQLLKPFNYHVPQKIFVNSMGDTHHPDQNLENVDEVYAVAALASQHQFQFLTKHPGQMKKYHAGLTWERLYDAALRFWNDDDIPKRLYKQIALRSYFENLKFPLPNVWLGTSVGWQKSIWRMNILKTIPAKIHYLSCEPLIGPITFDLTGIEWVIIGGESGHGDGIRPVNIDDIRHIVRQCREQNVSPFVKQLGRFPYENGARLLFKDHKGQDFDEFPVELFDLKVREFPAY